MTLRGDQKLRTLQRILEAALELLTEGGEDAVTMRSVAARAGVTERTVFRHVQNRERLVKYLWHFASELYPPSRPPRTTETLARKARIRFQALGRQRHLVRAYLQSQSRLNGPRRRVDRERAEALIRCLQTEMKDMEAEKLRRRAAIVDVLSSPYALEFLRQYWGFGGRQAGQAAAEAIEILLDRARLLKAPSPTGSSQ